MRVLMRICLILEAIAIPLTCILLAGVLISRVPDFYSFEFTRLQSIKNAEVSVNEKDMAQLFSDYINGKEEAFQIETEYNGTTKEIFSEKEQAHMEDVKRLVDYLTVALCVFAALLLVSISCIYYKKNKRMIRRGYNVGLIIYLAGIAALALTIILNFEKGFILFHKIFFTNDLWQLNPDQDVLLMIMPEQFFLEGAIIMLGISAIFMIAIRAVIWYFTKERGMFYGERN